MNIKQIDPREASEILQKNSDAIYIDVRTEQEFHEGHVPNAVNIPVVFPNPAHRQMLPNPDFLKVVEGNFPKEKKIICGCQAGGRSQYAAELLTQAGFEDVSNMQGGFGGARDPMGRTVVPGWSELGLPIETKVDSSNSYEEIKKRAQG